MASEAHTFLFMDLVGFSALTAERGDDRAAEVALALYARVRRLLPQHSGEEIKTIGDAMMVRCDDPRVQLLLGRAADLSPAEPRIRAPMVTAPGPGESAAVGDG